MQRSTKFILLAAGGCVAGFAAYKVWRWQKKKAESSTTESSTNATRGEKPFAETVSTSAAESAKVNLQTNLQSKGYQPIGLQVSTKPAVVLLPKVGVSTKVFVPEPKNTGTSANTGTNTGTSSAATASKEVDCWNSEDPWDCGQSTQLSGISVHYQPTCGRTLQLFKEALQPHRHKARFVLEPSAGYGTLAEVVRESLPDAQVHCLEVEQDLVSVLLDKGFAVQQADFLAFGTSLKYDLICMNPPYDTHDDSEAWKKHFFKALYLLQPSCVLICSLPMIAKNMLQSIDKQLFTVLQATEYEKTNGSKGLFLKVGNNCKL